MSALLRHEVRTILFGMRRRPLVPWIAAGMLALSIGANVAVFTVISRTLLRPLPYGQPERLLVIDSTFVEPDHTEEKFPAGSVEIVQWQQRTIAFSAIEAVRPLGMTVREDGDPANIPGANVTGGIFRLLRVHPIRGRDFAPEEDIPNANVAPRLMSAMRAPLVPLPASRRPRERGAARRRFQSPCCRSSSMPMARSMQANSRNWTPMPANECAKPL